MTRRLARIVLALALFALSAAAPARAAAITGDEVVVGSFSWQFDDLFGPIFTVENFAGSGIGLLGVVVDATLDDGAERPLVLGSIGDGEVRQTFEDLSLLTIQFATLTFDAMFVGDQLPGTFSVARVLFAGDTQPILFTPSSLNPDPVPEPSTLLLLGGGCAAWAMRRRPLRALR